MVKPECQEPQYILHITPQSQVSTLGSVKKHRKKGRPKKIEVKSFTERKPTIGTQEGRLMQKFASGRLVLQ
jgi:hypothetical protein